jgi:hypothetical protein
MADQFLLIFLKDFCKPNSIQDNHLVYSVNTAFLPKQDTKFPSHHKGSYYIFLNVNMEVTGMCKKRKDSKQEVTVKIKEMRKILGENCNVVNVLRHLVDMEY